MSQIKLTINGKSVVGELGDSVLKIAADNGIEIPNLCNNPELAVYGACGLCAVEQQGVPKLLRACSLMAKDGMVIDFETPRVKQSRKIALELLMSDHDGDCVAPCHLNCPAGTDCQGYVKHIAEGNYHEAVALIKEKLPIPASIGRVCPHPCEKACRRANVEQPISIAQLKVFAADKDLEKDTYVPHIGKQTDKKVAIVGGGPAGLTAAYFLRLKGHDVTIFEAMEACGGMLRYGIPEYRLPKAVLDSEIKEIESLGISIRTNVKIGKDITLEKLRQDFDAVILAIGAWSSLPLRCKGEELEGVVGGIDFLREVAFFNAGKGKNINIGKKVAVVGGGNTAMDACRSAIRTGAETVYVIYRRTRNEMPAEKEEIAEAEEEGVIYKFLTNPHEVIGKDGKVIGLKLQVMELGEPDASGRRAPIPVEGKYEYLEVDTVIAAIGQGLKLGNIEGIALNKKGNIQADEYSYLTNLEGVFAVGDATNQGAAIAIKAIGEANRCVEVVDNYLFGRNIPYREPFVSKTEPDVADPKFTEREKLARVQSHLRKAEDRKKDFLAIGSDLTEEEARREAKRCLECGCHDYKECKLIRYANQAEIDPDRLKGAKNLSGTDRVLVAIERNNDKCILCGQCVRMCDEVAKKGILGLIGRGFGTVVKAEYDDPKVLKYCADCKKCAESCPTGALRIIQ